MYFSLQPEPFFLSFSLYNAKEGRKISEDFHVDPNSSEIRAMIPSELLQSSGLLVNGSNGGRKSVEFSLNVPDMHWLEMQKQVFRLLWFVQHLIFLFQRSV